MARVFRSFVSALVSGAAGVSAITGLPASSFPAANAQTLDLFIDGQKRDVEIGKESIESINGARVKLRLERKEITTFGDDFVSFSYPGSLEVAKKKLSDHATQVFLASATGTLVIVQEYQSRDPADLTDLMIKTITKSDVSQGFTLEQESSSITLKNGKVVKGIAVTTTRGVKKHFFTFSPYGDDRKGLFIVTRISEEEEEADGKILTIFWDTLTPKF